MSQRRFFPHLVNLNQLETEIIHNYAAEKGLGRRGFSAALRRIVREWYLLRMIVLPGMPIQPPESVRRIVQEAMERDPERRRTGDEF